jgi:hypothetical protein
MKFRTALLLEGKTATGLQVPDDVVEKLAAGKRPKVVITLNGHSYRTTVASMGGRYLVPVSAENRVAAGITAGQEVDVDIELDAAPREVEVPTDLEAALSADPAARAFFDGLSFTYRKEWARSIEGAKKPETRTARVEKAVIALRAGKRTH